AVFFTFILSGFWHGTAFHYTFWGMLHGSAMAWDVASSKPREWLRSKMNTGFYNAVSVLLTFAFLSFSGIFFKAGSIEIGKTVLLKIFQTDFSLFTAWASTYPWVLAIIIAVLVLQFPLSKWYLKILDGWQTAPAFACAFALVAT